MINILYVFWFLFPLVFFLLAAWAWLKPYFKVAGKENGKDYLIQGLFCLLGCFPAIAIDSTEKYLALINALSSDLLNLNVLRFLLYPAILVLMAYIQHYFSKKKEPAKKVVPRKSY